MELFNSYTAVVIISIIVILSYFFNIISAKTNIPSVLLLIALGILINVALDYFNIPAGASLFDVLEILGIIGLILIVLEAALDLELSKEKWPLISKSFLVAFFSLIVCSFAIAYLLHIILIDNFFTALIYAIPLAVTSSSIVIPSVGELLDEKKEFMVYESTFSDILGIMYFYFLIGNADNPNLGSVVWDVVSNVFITVVLSILISYALVLIFQKVRAQIKLFLLIAVLMLLYSIGKMFHLSSLIIILIFGLVLNNHKLLFRGKLKKFIDPPMLNSILSNFHLVTIESAFVVRTFFFVIFGLMIDLSRLANREVFLISLAVVFILFGIRAIFLRFIKGRDIVPEVLISPRGLITILLFFAIPAELSSADFSTGILLYTIILSSLIMAIVLMASGKHIEPVEAVKMAYWHEVDKEIESIPESEKHKPVDEKEAAKKQNAKDDQKSSGLL